MMPHEPYTKSVRIQKIISILQERNGASVRDLATELGVSEMTIRRDFDHLSKTNVIKRVHGAVIFNPDFAENEALLAEDDCVPVDETLYQTLGRAAAALIEPNDMIFIDCGAPAAETALALPANSPLNIFTYSAIVFQKLLSTEHSAHLYFVGGTYHPQSNMCSSEQSASILNNFRFNKAFLFPDGIHAEFGVTCAHMYEVASKRAVMSSALHTILVADSSLFGSVSRNYISALTSVDTVVTDECLSAQWQHHLHELGIRVILAK